MKEYIDVGEIVEGKKCKIYTRREDCKGLRADPITQKRMLVYELDRNSSVEVEEVLSLSPSEQELRKRLNVHGQVGDKLKADAITIYIDVKRQLRFETKEGMTATHGGRLLSTKNRTIGQIKYPFQNLNTLLGLSAKNDKQLEK